jgi:hypothetical protein
VQGDSVENLDRGAVLEDQALNDVETVQLGLGSGDVGQIPASGRRGSASPGAGIQRAAAGQDAVAGAQRRHLGNARLHQHLPDRAGTDGTEVARGQIPACLQDQILQSGGRAARLARGARAIGPSDAIQALAFRSCDPVGNRGDPDAEPTGNRAQGLATTDRRYHGTTTLGLTFCLLIGPPRGDPVLGEL